MYLIHFSYQSVNTLLANESSASVKNCDLFLTEHCQCAKGQLSCHEESPSFLHISRVQGVVSSVVDVEIVVPHPEMKACDGA